MSGGHFEYKQYYVADLADAIRDEMRDKSWAYSDGTLREFETAVELLKQAAIYVQRIDWLLSDDDSEETFHQRLKEDLADL